MFLPDQMVAPDAQFFVNGNNDIHLLMTHELFKNEAFSASILIASNVVYVTMLTYLAYAFGVVQLMYDNWLNIFVIVLGVASLCSGFFLAYVVDTAFCKMWQIITEKETEIRRLCEELDNACLRSKTFDEQDDDDDDDSVYPESDATSISRASSGSSCSSQDPDLRSNSSEERMKMSAELCGNN
jgi:hypothetical protein